MTTIIALFGAFFTALSLVMISKLLKREQLCSLSVTSLVHLFAFSTACFFINPIAAWQRLVAVGALGNALAAALLICVGRVLFTYSYGRLDVARAGIFSTLTPIYTLAAAYFMLGETVSTTQGIAIVTALFAIVMVTQTKDTNAFKPEQRRMALWAAFLSSLPAVFSAIFQKKALAAHALPSDLLIITLATIGLVALLVHQVIDTPSRTNYQHALRFWKHWLANGMLIILANLCFFYTVAHAPVAIAQAAQRLSIIFQLFLAYWLLGEKGYFLRRFVSAIVCVISVIIMI